MVGSTDRWGAGRRIAAVMLVTTALSAACAGTDAPDGGASVVRDSAGVAIVESR